MAQDDLRIEELELVGSDSLLSDEAPAPSRSNPRRIVAASLGLLATVACVALAVLSGGGSAAGQPPLNAIGLLGHPDVHGAAAANLIKSRRLLGGKDDLDDKEMHRLVAEQFQKYQEDLKETQPQLYEALHKTPVTDRQLKATVHALGFRSDKRMQRLGLVVARALSAAKTTDEKKLKLHLSKALSAHREELTQLREEMFPDPEMRALLGTSSDGEALKHLLHPDRLKLMGTFNKEWDKILSEPSSKLRRLSSLWGAQKPATATSPTWGQPTQPATSYASKPATATANGGWTGPQTAATPSAITTTNHPLATTEITLGMINAALEEAGCVLRIIKPVTKEFHKDLNVPPDVTSAIGGLSAIIGITDCEVNAAMDDYDPVEMGGCPLEFGSEAFDAMREVFTVLGILGDNNPKDGVQGNHNDESQVHEGLLNDPDSIFGVDAKK